MDWGYVATHLTPVAAMGAAILVYVAAATWIWNRRHPASRELVERKAA